MLVVLFAVVAVVFVWLAERFDPQFTKKQSAEGCEWCGQERNCGRCEQPQPCDLCAEDWIYPIYDLDDDGRWYISAWTCECR